MSTYATAVFVIDGVAQLGLSPTVRIIRISDNVVVVTDEAMTEVGDGFYKYEFLTYDYNEEYAVKFDGGAGLDDVDRYIYTGTDQISANDVWRYDRDA